MASEASIEAVLRAIQSTMEQMKESQKENSEMYKMQFECMQQVQKENSQLHTELFTLLKASGAAKVGVSRDSDTDVDSNERGSEKRSNKPKPIRPTIEEGVDDFGWDLFLDKWQRYKSIARLEETSEICLELRESCSPEINRLLFDFIGRDTLNDDGLTEENLLKFIKQVAVRSVHKEVHRWHFNQMSQTDGEKITKLVGRLKAQSVLCDFSVACKCGEKVSYAEEMVSQKLTAGVSNPEHQSKVLGEAESLDSLAKKVERLISLETAEDATTRIRTPIQTRAMPAKSSEYRKRQKQSLIGSLERGRSNVRKPRDRKRRCRGCGRSDHGNGKTLERKECPAFGKKCDTCGKDNHFSKVCERRSRASYAKAEGDTSHSEESETESEFADHSDFDDTIEDSYSYSAQVQDFRERHHQGARR